MNEKSMFTDCSEKELKNINGGLLAGSLVGGVLGLQLGLVVGAVATVATGDRTGNVMYKNVVAFTSGGAAVGLYTPF